MIRRVLDLPPTTIPTKPVAEIASYGSASVWVDPAQGVVVRRGGKASSLALEAKGLKDLDLGPAADGTPTAVYARCASACKVYAFALKPGAKERTVRAAAGGRRPTLWKGTLAFERSGWVYTTKLDASAPAKKLMSGTSFDDMELGPREIAFAGEYDSDEGNGITEVDLVPLSKPRGDWYTLDDQVIGEGSAAGFGGITAAADGTFTWQRAFRTGCGFAKRVARAGSMKRVGATIEKSAAPLAARYADPDIPATPESEGCDEE